MGIKAIARIITIGMVEAGITGRINNFKGECMKKKWEALIKQRLFHLIQESTWDVTKLSKKLGHDPNWLTRIKYGRNRLDWDLVVVPVLVELGKDPKAFFQEVIDEKAFQEWQELTSLKQLNLNIVYD